MKGSLYEEKIINLIKSKIKLASKEVNSKEAEKIITEFNKPNIGAEKSKTTSPKKIVKNKKLVKSNQLYKPISRELDEKMNSLIPMVEQTQGERAYDIYSRLLKENCFFSWPC